jgi:cytidylate kinase
VARVLAPTLAYRLVDEELPHLIGARLGTTAEVVDTLENRSPGFGERLLAGLSGAVPEISAPAPIPVGDLATDYRREAERLIREAALEGDAVIVGRLASAVLGARPDVLRVFVYAPLAWRIANVRESLGYSEPAARSEIGRIDEARRRFAREHYRMSWGDPHSYDLAVDTARYGVEGAAAVVACAVRAAQAAT